MHTKAWRTELMGSKGWAVFMPNPVIPRFEIMIASNLSEEHARLIAQSPAMLEACITAYEHIGGVHHRQNLAMARLSNVIKATSHADTLKGELK